MGDVARMHDLLERASDVLIRLQYDCYKKQLEYPSVLVTLQERVSVLTQQSTWGAAELLATAEIVKELNYLLLCHENEVTGRRRYIMNIP
jgi:hypothetical protein